MATAEDYKRLGKWAVMYSPTNIDRRKCSRKVPMAVLNFSMPRTGTLSMQEALEILGYPTYHFASVFENCRDSDMWNQAFQAKYNGVGEFGKQEFDQLLGHVAATCDVPTICFWRELLEYYPDAKVILVERDEDKWYESISLILAGTLNPIGQWVLRYTDPFFVRVTPKLNSLVVFAEHKMSLYGRVISTGTWWTKALMGSTNLNHAKANARLAYGKHYAEIRAAVPKERLLEYSLGSGWEPLCKFLEKDVPKDTVFPFRNEANVVEKALGAFLQKAGLNSLRNLSVVVSIGAVAWTLGRRVWERAVEW